MMNKKFLVQVHGNCGILYLFESNGKDSVKCSEAFPVKADNGDPVKTFTTVTFAKNHPNFATL